MHKQHNVQYIGRWELFSIYRNFARSGRKTTSCVPFLSSSYFISFQEHYSYRKPIYSYFYYSKPIYSYFYYSKPIYSYFYNSKPIYSYFCYSKPISYHTNGYYAIVTENLWTGLRQFNPLWTKFFFRRFSDIT